MGRRVRVKRPDQNLQLRVHPSFLLRIRTDDRERARSFAVQAHVFRKALAEYDLVPLFDKVSDGKGVVVGVSGGEALVGHVKEREVLLLLDDIGQFLPLIVGRVHTSRLKKKLL